MIRRICYIAPVLVLRIVLLPFTLLYAAAIAVRNLFYRLGVLNRTEFDIPVICIGNLSAGGTGKTPHIEHLLRGLEGRFALAVLSRGYKRRTSGYVLADENASPALIGDEPFQIHRKFPRVAVGVCENRVLGIPSLLGDTPSAQAVLMDDGFQHLPVKAGLNILLTSRHNLFTRDWMLPSGRLREFRSAYKRADIIIVTKCDPLISEAEQQQIRSEIAPLPNQEVLFSSIAYQNLVPVTDAPGVGDNWQGRFHILGFSGIADAEGFEQTVKTAALSSYFVRFADHHAYSASGVEQIIARFQHMPEPRILVTTEKDAVKLADTAFSEMLKGVSLYYLPMEVQLIGKQKDHLVNRVSEYISSFHASNDSYASTDQ